MAEFCPRCTAPLETSQDADRLCEVCGWFGDQQETLLTPPIDGVNNPILCAAQTLELYRKVCHDELRAEQRHQAGEGSEADLRRVYAARRHAAHSILAMFVALHDRAMSTKQRLCRTNGMVPWPANWTDRHHSGGREPCDMLVGPCSCGAWHLESDDWVRAMLFKHNAEIIDEL